MESMKDIIQRMKNSNSTSRMEFVVPTPKEMAEMRCESENNRVGDRDKLDGYNCPICKNKGLVYKFREEEGKDGETFYIEYMEDCSCAGIRKTIMRGKRTGLGEKLSTCKFGNFEANSSWQKQIKLRAMEFVQQEDAKIFFIGGQSGCGKTHICTAMAGQLVTQGKELQYAMWRDESVKLKGMMNRDGNGYQDAIYEMKRVDVLYIDDFLKVPLGIEENKPTIADLSLALEIINNRYNAKKTTIISSEWTLRDIISFDEALGGRIYELAGDQFNLSIKKDQSKNYRMRGLAEL